jgi:cyanate permease
MGSIIKRKETIIMGVCAAGPFLAYNGLMSWLPTYYNENFSLSLSDAGFIAGMGNLFAVPVCIIGSLMIMKTGLRKPFIIVPGILIGFAALMSFLVNNVVLLYVSIAVFGMSFFIFQPAIMTLAMELPGMTPQRATIVIAIAWAIGNFAGFFGPLIIGLLKDMSGSYLPGLLVCSILSLSLFIGGFFLPETGSRARRRD